MVNKEKLFTEFQAPTTQEWLDKIEVDLKGADFQKNSCGEQMKALMYSLSIAVRTWRT